LAFDEDGVRVDVDCGGLDKFAGEAGGVGVAGYVADGDLEIVLV
jgi:hypothetical protein